MTLYDEMLASYDKKNPRAAYEVSQQIILAGLHRGGFFNHAAFYGGTCLRIFHNLQRFSEDMDFSLLKPNPDFRFEVFFPFIVAEFEAMGRHVEIKKKDKRTFGKVESAFLKDTTDVYSLVFQTQKTLKIKIEVDTQPPLKFDTEQKMLFQPYSFSTRCMSLPCLFAGKMHSLVYRAWINRIKGRDWYDFEWYVRHNVPLDFAHLQERIYQFGEGLLDRETFMAKLKERLATGNIDSVKEDVQNFIIDHREMDIWSNDYFLLLADNIRFV